MHTHSLGIMAEHIPVSNHPSQDLAAISEVVQNGPGKGRKTSCLMAIYFPRKVLIIYYFSLKYKSGSLLKG